MNEQPKLNPEDVPVAGMAALGLLGALGAAAYILGRHKHERLSPRFLGMVVGSYEHFVCAMVAIDACEFGLAKKSLATAEYYADMALVHTPEHKVSIPSDFVSDEDGFLVLRHAEDVERWKAWLREETLAVERAMLLKPGALKCDLCGARLALPQVRYCQHCLDRACVAVADQSAVDDRLTAWMIEADMKRQTARDKQDAAP